MPEDAHDLLPDAIAAELPRLYATEKDDDPLVRLKWFLPMTEWTWYIIEYDPADRLCFGIVVGFEREYGYISLDEIESLEHPTGLKVERDLHWKPKPASECQ